MIGPIQILLLLVLLLGSAALSLLFGAVINDADERSADLAPPTGDELTHKD